MLGFLMDCEDRLRVSYSGIAVNPSMNPSRVQLRRYAIHGSLTTTTPKYSLIMCIAGTITALIPKIAAAKHSFSLSRLLLVHTVSYTQALLQRRNQCLLPIKLIKN